MSLKIKEGIDIGENVKEGRNGEPLEQALINDPSVYELIIDRMDAESRKVAVHIAGYIAKKLLAQRKYLCCKNYLIGVLSESNPDHDYIRRLSRGGLTIPSSELTEYVCAAFAILEYTEHIIVSSELPAHLSLIHI